MTREQRRLEDVKWRMWTGTSRASSSAGALHMGLGHGAFCLGCCWFLMGLLFYGGVMSPYWILGLAVYVLLEKLMPAGHRLALLTAPALIACGAIVIAAAV